MGLGSFRSKIPLIIISVFLLWQSSKVWLSFTQEKTDIEAQPQDSEVTTLSQNDERTQQKVHIAVYYEALCPDSRSFFTKQLLPTYHKIPDSIEVELIPYGKATTMKIESGYEFICQHGPTECDANIIHACSIDILKNSSVQLEYVSCMIKNNIDPVNIMKICAQKMNIDYNKIFKCFTEEKGKELLAKYGEQTNSLIPTVSFIPTILLDGSSDYQARILKNLLQEVCLHLKFLPEHCKL
ncbi:gamma-interferon-inducible lysosomal thiol reductase-like protein [Nomia melanderi]|uniref:gamma-interferon-inducible lysosomal thiol reductase-like protein n=1 Tax=Nomia melanderi TaxID=2448451 RepID=UPI0013044AE6|nr:GILT-like protein C02D5.2 [Nomia melanderi]